MSRVRLLLLTVLAAFAVGALASASASAFVVELCKNEGAGHGKYKDAHCELTGGLEEYEWLAIPNGTEILDSTGLSTLKSVVVGKKLDIDCTKSKSKGTLNTNGLNLDTTVFEECQLYEIGTSTTLLCVLPNIETKLHSELVGVLTTPEEKFVPESGTIFATIKLCGALGTIKVEGEITCQLPGAATSALAHDISCVEADKGLKVGKEEAFFITLASVTLENGAAWRTS